MQSFIAMTMTMVGFDRYPIFTNKYRMVVCAIIALILIWGSYVEKARRKLELELNSITLLCANEFQSNGCFPSGDIVKFEYIEYERIDSVNHQTAIFTIGDDKTTSYGVKARYENDSSIIEATAYCNIDAVKKNNSLKLSAYDAIGSCRVER